MLDIVMQLSKLGLECLAVELVKTLSCHLLSVLKNCSAGQNMTRVAGSELQMTVIGAHQASWTDCCRASADAAKAEVAELHKLEEQLQQALRIEAEWCSKPSASYIGAAVVGAVQQE